MPVIGVREVLIKPVFTDLQQKVAKELDGVADGAADRAGSSAGKRMSGAMGVALKTGAIAAGAAAGAGLALALTKGFGRLQAIENAKAKLTGLGHDVETVTGIMNNAMAAVKGTAFGLDEAATVAAGAVAAGVKPGIELERTLRLTGDAATIAGVGMSDMGAIFNKVASSNKIQGDVIAQLQDAGIPVVQLMAKELGVTAEETVKLASEGKINFETFQKAMENGLGGAALESGKTLQGAFKNTMAAVGRIGANLLSGVYPKIQQFFSGAIEWLKPLEEGAKVAGAAIGKFLEDAINGAQGLYDLFVKGDFSGKLASAFGWQEDSPLVDFLFKAREGAIGLYDLLVNGNYSGMLRSAFGWEEDSVFVDFLLTVRDAVLKIPDALGQVISVSKDVAKWLWDMREPIGVIAGLIIVTLIPHWVALGVEALKSAAKQATAWAITRSSATKAAFVHSGAVTAMVAGWIVLGVRALGTAALWGIAYALISADAIKAAAVHAGTVAKMVAGWVVMGAQAMANAARIAAAWFIALGPIGWIIGAVIGIGAAIWAAYENIGWFRDGVDAAIRAVGGFFTWLWTDIIKPVFDGIAAAITWVYESIIKPAFDGISAAVGFVGDAFTAFYESTLKPIFDSAAVIIGGFLLFFRGMGQLIASVVQHIVVPIFKWMWDNMIAVFAGIGGTIAGWWNFAVGIFNGAIGFVRDVFGAAFTWLYESVIKPVFDGIGAAIAWVWTNVLKPTFDAWVHVFTVVIPQALRWLHENVVKPVFDAIGAAISWIWVNVLKPTFDAWVFLFQNVLAPAFKWLHENVIKPVFDGIGNSIKWVWENVIKPVFDFLSKTIMEDIPKAFDTGVAAVKRIWETILDIAKAPVRFVIDTVINDGLIGAFNTVAGMLPGIDKLPRVALPAGFADGGYTGPGGKYQPAGIVHAGEIVWSQDDISRWGGVGVVEAMRKAVGYARGGLVHPLRNSVVSQPFHGGHNGIDFAAPTGTPIGAAGPGRVSSAGWSAHGGGNEIHIDHPNGLQTWYAHLSSFAVKLGDMVRGGSKIGEVGSTGNSTGPHLHYMVMNGGWPNYVNPASYLEGGGEAGGGWNPISGIIDGLLSKFKEAFPAAGFMADMAIGVGKKLLDGAVAFVTGNGGTDDGIGSTGLPYLHDQGGVVNPGLSAIMNRTRQPEALLNPQQWADIHRLAVGDGTGQRGGTNFYGPVHVRDENELARVLRTSEQDAQAVYGW